MLCGNQHCTACCVASAVLCCLQAPRPQVDAGEVVPTLPHGACRDPANGYVQDDTVTLTATFNVINESSSFGRSLDKGLPAGKARLKAKATTGDVFEGKFSWKVEQFTKLKVGACFVFAACMTSNAALSKEPPAGRLSSPPSSREVPGRSLVQDVCQGNPLGRLGRVLRF